MTGLRGFLLSTQSMGLCVSMDMVSLLIGVLRVHKVRLISVTGYRIKSYILCTRRTFD